MKKPIRLTSLVLVLLMLVSMAVSCGDTNVSEDTSPVAETTQGAGESAAETAYNELDHVKIENLGGAEIKILTPSRDWAIENMTAEEITGDTIQDAIAERQLAVEAKLNCKLSETVQTEDVTTRLMSTAAASGDDSYDLALVQPYNALSLYVKGYTADMSTLENIDLSNPWWEADFNADVNMGSKRYIAFGNANLIFYSSFYIYCFNKEMITSYNLENPYELVQSGDWTWDKVYEMMKVVATDVGQDGLSNPNSEDILGLTGHINHSRNLIFSSGYTICEKDAEGRLTYNGLSENYINAFEKYTEYFIKSPMVAITGTSENRYTGYTAQAGIKNYVSVFVEGRSLFLTTGTNEVMQIRDSEHEYGIVVVPKASKEQAEYVTPVYSATEGFVIPVASGNAERAALVLDVIGAYSYQNIVDKHISIVLHYRAAQDATAIRMINMAYENGAIDTAMANNFGQCTSMLNNLNVAASTNISTVFTAIKKKMQTDLEAANDMID